MIDLHGLPALLGPVDTSKPSEVGVRARMVRKIRRPSDIGGVVLVAFIDHPSAGRDLP